MKLVLTVILSVFAMNIAYAGDGYRVSKDLYCVWTVPARPAVEAADQFFSPDADDASADPFRKRQAEKVFEDYVKPAMVAACADATKDSVGLLSDVHGACARGCDEVNGQWTVLKEGERRGLRLKCDVECARGYGVLRGLALGVVSTAQQLSRTNDPKRK